MPFENAFKLIQSLGFNYIWVNGKSGYELGMVYEQAPAAGMYYVPHRTSVLLRRSSEEENFYTFVWDYVEYCFTYISVNRSKSYDKTDLVISQILLIAVL